MKVKMQIWDTAGLEEYKAINRLYYSKAAVICLVYSDTDYESFDSLAEWHKEIAENADKNCLKFVVGAKSDDTEAEETVPKSQGVEYARQIGATYFLTSAKTNSGINNMFNKAAEMCAVRQELRNDVDVSLKSGSDLIRVTCSYANC